MTYLDKILNFFGIGMKIHFIAEDQDDGHTFIRSPELKGFTLMLAREQTENIRTLMDAIYDPLIAYLKAYKAARHAAPKEIKIQAFSAGRSHSYTARLCPC